MLICIDDFNCRSIFGKDYPNWLLKIVVLEDMHIPPRYLLLRMLSKIVCMYICILSAILISLWRLLDKFLKFHSLIKFINGTSWLKCLGSFSMRTSFLSACACIKSQYPLSYFGLYYKSPHIPSENITTVLD